MIQIGLPLGVMRIKQQEFSYAFFGGGWHGCLGEPLKCIHSDQDHLELVALPIMSWSLSHCFLKFIEMLWLAVERLKL